MHSCSTANIYGALHPASVVCARAHRPALAISGVLQDVQEAAHCSQHGRGHLRGINSVHESQTTQISCTAELHTDDRVTSSGRAGKRSTRCNGQPPLVCRTMGAGETSIRPRYCSRWQDAVL